MKGSLAEIPKKVFLLLCVYISYNFQRHLHHTCNECSLRSDKKRNAAATVGHQHFLQVTTVMQSLYNCFGHNLLCHSLWLTAELTASLCSQAGEAHAGPRFIFIQVWKWCISAPGKPSNCLWPELVGHDPETAYCVYWDEQQRGSTFTSLTAVYGFNADFDGPFIAFVEALYSSFSALLFFQGGSNHKINIWVTMNVHRSRDVKD